MQSISKKYITYIKNSYYFQNKYLNAYISNMTFE